MVLNRIKINGVEYLSTDPYVVKDALTGDYIHTRNQETTQIPINIYLHRAKEAGLKFNINSSKTHNIYGVQNGTTLYSNYKELMEKSSEELDELLLNVTTVTLGAAVIFVLNEETKSDIIKKLGLVRGILNPSTYYDKDELNFMDKPKPYRKFDNTYSKVLLRDIFLDKLTTAQTSSSEVRDIMKNVMKRNIEMGVESLTYKELENIKYTYGLELETCSGRLEESEVADLNFKAVHDGSLREADGSNPVGGEYVTGVLVGDAGLSQLHEMCRVLQTKCKVDKRCGVHAHIGSLNWNKEDVVYSYLLAEQIEKDLFSILPKSRRTNTYCREINKFFTSATNDLSLIKDPQEYSIKIDELFNIIFCEVSGGHTSPSRNISKEVNHPKGSKCGYDKSSQRYCWLNYVTLLFNTKGVANSHTLEFRPMSGTLNYLKIKNWLKICMAFCSFVENHKTLIKNGFKTPVTLEVMLSKVYPKTGAALISYVKERRQLFLSADESVDYAVDSTLKKKSRKEIACAS